MFWLIVLMLATGGPRMNGPVVFHLSGVRSCAGRCSAKSPRTIPAGRSRCILRVLTRRCTMFSALAFTGW